MPGNSDYDLQTLNDSDLWSLLPYVVRAQDPGAIRHFFGALARQHNFLVERLREMPRSQDPYQAGSFSPEAFGEDPALVREWVSLKRVRIPDAAQTVRIGDLEEAVPRSVSAYAREQAILRLLARSVGENLEIGLPDFALRPLIATAIQRHAIKGSPSSFDILGRILGIFEMKTRELWSRFSLHNSFDPASRENDGDYASVPEQYPYWPRGDRYGAADASRQWPPPSSDYNPFVLDDGGTLDLAFDHLVANPRSVRYYGSLNGRNPFILLSDVPSPLAPGIYTLIGGSDSQRASVSIPLKSGDGSVLTTALAAGNYGNAITVTVVSNPGTQKILIHGPVSRVKFKASVFDLVIGVDADAFYSLIPAVPVRVNASATPSDSALGRTPPDYPVTGTVAGSRVISDPATDFQMDLDGFAEAMTVLWGLVEGIRPLTRTVRRRSVGLILNSGVRYAPSCVMAEVVLEAPDGTNRRLAVRGGQPEWDVTADAPTAAPVQFDRALARWIQWTMNGAGSSFLAVPVSPPLSGDIVFIRGGGGFVYSSAGTLYSAGAYPEATEEIHGDGTPDESIVSADYTLVSDSPPAQTAAFMSPDAVYSGPPPPDCLLFMPVPEDEITVRNAAIDQDKFHVAAHFGTEDLGDGDLNANWYYGIDGQMHGTDLRYRQAGVQRGLVDPAPSGVLSLAPIVEFLDLHGRVVTRLREDGSPVLGEYTLDAPDAATGPTLLSYDSLSDEDGPSEGVVPAGWSVIEAIDAGLHGDDTDTAWKKYHYFEFLPLQPFADIFEDSGFIALRTASTLFPGTPISVYGTSTHNGPYVVKVSGDATVTTAVWDGVDGPGTAWVRTEPVALEGSYDFSVSFASAGAGTSQWRIWSQTGADSPILVGAYEMTAAGAMDTAHHVEADRVWFEAKGDLTLTCRLIFASAPPVLARAGRAMAAGMDRDDLQIIVVDDGQKWWEYGASGTPDSLDPIGPDVQWRGGNWADSDRSGTYTERPGIPDEVSFS